MIKPDAVKAKHIGDIIREIERNFIIVDIKYTRLTKTQAREFYAIHKGKDFYKPLVNFITSGPVVALLLEGENVQQRLRDFIGATDPQKAKKGTIRAKYGTSIRENAVHASNPYEDPKREIKLFFPYQKKHKKICK